MNIKLQKIAKAKGSSETDDLDQYQQASLWNDRIVSLGLDGSIKLWSLDLTLIKQINTKQSYQVSLCVNGHQLITGKGNGQISIFDNDLNHVRNIKICEDMISDIKIYEDKLLITAIDGTFCRSNLSTYEIINKIVLPSNLKNVCFFEGKYYVAGTSSFKINQQFSTIQQINRANLFFAHDGQLYSLTDEKGLLNLSQQYATFQPCEAACILQNHIIGVTTDQAVTVFSKTDLGMGWKIQKIPQFLPGYTIRAVVSINNHEVIFAGDQGDIIKLKFIDI